MFAVMSFHLGMARIGNVILEMVGLDTFAEARRVRCVASSRDRLTYHLLKIRERESPIPEGFSIAPIIKPRRYAVSEEAFILRQTLTSKQN
jgi:hypothetical protein